MEPSATAEVILGQVAMRPRTGYEIKAFADRSTDAPTGGRQAIAIDQGVPLAKLPVDDEEEAA